MITLAVEGIDSPKLTRAATLLSEYTDYNGKINARVVASGEVQRLNADYAGDNRPTDVLSFSYVEDNPGTRELGDIVISQEHIIDQSQAAGTSQEAEALLLLIHGCLHILGYEHATRRQQKQMEAIQRRIMQQLDLAYREFAWKQT